MPIDITIDEGLAFVSLNIYFYGYICWESDGRGKSLMDHLSSLPLPGFPLKGVTRGVLFLLFLVLFLALPAPSPAAHLWWWAGA